MLLVPSREENISCLGVAALHNLAPKYIGCQAKRQRVQWDPQTVQLHPLHPPDCGPGDFLFGECLMANSRYNCRHGESLYIAEY